MHSFAKRRFSERRCFWCGLPVIKARRHQQHNHNIATVEHLLAAKDGGPDEAWNLRLACAWCNQGRDITGGCIAALACVQAVIGRAPLKEVTTWWRTATAASRGRELQRLNEKEKING